MALAEFLVDLDLFWDGATLWVNSKYRNHPKRFDKVKVTLDSCMHFSTWSKTRWGRSGTCVRKKVRACLVGLDEIFAIAVRQGSSMRKLVGFAKSSHEVRLVYIVMAMSCYPCESVVFSIWEDDRGLRRAAELWETLKEEFDYIVNLTPYCWSRLAVITQGRFSGNECRHFAIMSALRSIAYFYSDSLSSLEEYPLRMTQGDVYKTLKMCLSLKMP